MSSSPPPPPATSSPNGQEAGSVGSIITGDEAATVHLEKKKAIKKVKSLILLLANLATTITYQAGLDPPGGFWPEDGEGHRAGDAILLSKDPARYKAFFYCNSTAFVVSLVVILMVQKEKLVKSHTLLVAMTLDMFALIGAYAAGSCRDLRTSVHVVALAGAILVYVFVHVLIFTMGTTTDVDARVPEKKHKRLLLVAILVATITYQVGLAPPGGFWNEDDSPRYRHAGDAVLLDRFPRRFKVFFYSNTVSFMASIALILLLVNPILSRLAIRCYALYACQVVGLFGLMAAYTAGSARKLRTSIFACVLIAAVIAFVLVNTITLTFFNKRRRMMAWADEAPSSSSMAQQQPRRQPQETEYRDEVYAKRKYLMLLGILAASVTYQAGLAPPGGLWQDDGGDGGGTRRSREAGNPVLHDTDPRRYHVFFYSNSTSFVASIVTIALLLQQILRRHHRSNQKLLLIATNTALVLDLLGLLAAYAAGSTREWRNVVVLPLLVLLFMAIHVAVWLFGERRRCAAGEDGGTSTSKGRGLESN